MSFSFKLRGEDQSVYGHNNTDEDGNPTGGSAQWPNDPPDLSGDPRLKQVLIDRVGVTRIQWQDGPLGRGAERRLSNGAMVEDVIKVCIKRMQFYQDSKFKCRENALAITKLEEALHWMNARTQDREERQVEGAHIA